MNPARSWCISITSGWLPFSIEESWLLLARLFRVSSYHQQHINPHKSVSYQWVPCYVNVSKSHTSLGALSNYLTWNIIALLFSLLYLCLMCSEEHSAFAIELRLKLKQNHCIFIGAFVWYYTEWAVSLNNIQFILPFDFFCRKYPAIKSAIATI